MERAACGNQEQTKTAPKAEAGRLKKRQPDTFGIDEDVIIILRMKDQQKWRSLGSDSSCQRIGTPNQRARTKLAINRFLVGNEAGGGSGC